MAKKKKTEQKFIAYMTSSDVAKMAGVKVSTVTAARTKGHLHPASSIGNNWGYL